MGPKRASRQSFCRDDGYVLSRLLKTLTSDAFFENFYARKVTDAPILAQTCSSRREIKRFSQCAPRFAGANQEIQFP